MSKHRPDLGTHGLPRARARRGPHRPCPRVTNPASRPSRPSGACGRPARGAPRAACRAARGIVSPPLAGFPRARPRPRPPTPRPRAPDAPPSFSFFSMAVRACLSTGRRRGRGEGRRRPQLRRRRSAAAPPALTEYRALRAAAQADLAHPSPRASRLRSWHTWRRLSGPSLRRSTPCEVAGGRNSAAVAPPAQPSIGR